jgi:hypothetical protein
MTWYTHLKITQQKKKINPIQIKKNPPKLKLTHPTQIKLTLKLDSNSLPLYNKSTCSVISLLSLCFLSLTSLYLLSLSQLSLLLSIFAPTTLKRDNIFNRLEVSWVCWVLGKFFFLIVIVFIVLLICINH